MLQLRRCVAEVAVETEQGLILDVCSIPYSKRNRDTKDIEFCRHHLLMYIVRQRKKRRGKQH